MGKRLDRLVDDIRAKRGHFFLARLNLRLSFSLDQPDLPDNEEYERELLEASSAMGYTPAPIDGPRSGRG
jgi:hypothetical protein